MICSKILSGLGNQLFQYAVGKSLSIRKNTELKLDISFFNDQKLRSYKLDAFNINAQIATENEISQYTSIDTLSKKIYLRAEKLLPRTKRKVFKESTPWIFEPLLDQVSQNIYLDGYWQHYKYFKDINPIIFKELVVKESYNTTIQNTIAKIIADQNSVSIHIRRGDYLTDSEANKLMGVLPLSYYYKAINIIKHKLFNPNFYIFSDDLNWARNNLTTDSDLYYIDSGKDYIDLDLMSKCKHNIIANSSFSWWGAFLNLNPDKIVIGPKQWVIPSAINKRIELLFPTWEKI